MVREEFQAALDTGLLDLRGRPGPHYVDIPPYPRPIPTLVMPDGAQIIGDGAVVVFRGDPQGHDWAGIRVGDNWRITGVNFAVEEPGGTWDEQSHVLEIVGPVAGGELSYCSFDHPVVAGSSRGDCIRFRGYPEKQIHDITVHHCTFKRSARSGIAMYGGLHGARFHHLVFRDVADQDLDCETAVAGGVDFEWDNNVHHVGPSAQSAIAVSLYPGSVHFHHNHLVGRGLDMLGGSHHVHHNVIVQTVRTDDPMAYLRKAGSTRIHDEQWTRAASAGPGAVFAAATKLTAPSNVTLDDIRMVQGTPRTSIVVSGVDGIAMRGLLVADVGPTGVRDCIRVEGTALTCTTPVLISDCELVGTFRAAVSVSGSYHGGVGAVEVRDCTAAGAATMLRQENVERTATNGGIAGPVTTADNVTGGQ